MIRILTDSTCDLPSEVVRRHGIVVVPAYINSGQHSWRDQVELTRGDFYRDLPGYDPYPTTAAPAPAEFAEVYRELVAEGAREIIAVHVAGTLSSIPAASRAGAADVDVPVHFVDSGQLSMGLGWQVLTAARLAAAGESAPAIVEHLEKLQKRITIYALIDSLRSLRRSGRVNWLQMRVGNLLKLKLLLQVHQGKVEPIGRVRTRARAIEQLVEVAGQHRPIHQIAFLNTDAADFDLFRQRFDGVLTGQEELLAATAGPAIGVHVGSGALAIALVTRPD